MTLTPARTPSRDLRTLFHVGTLGGLTDGQLMERFATRRDEGAELAFAALVERHGPMVLRVCRGVLRDDHEAMDAFQATFLVLARKGGALWVRDSLGPWLHRVACRAAEKAKAQEGRRRALESRAAEALEGKAGGDDRDDHTTALHEELDRLPDRYRVPIVLCDLEGRTCEEVAQHLGRSVRTVKSWRARGRERLRDRLTRRGLGVPTAVPVAGLLPPAAQAAPSASLADSTTRAAMQIAAGRPLAGVVSAAVLAVMKGVLRGLFMNSLKGAALAVVTLGALAAWAGGLAWAGLREPTGDQESPSSSRASLPAVGVERPRFKEPEVRDTDDIQGRWEVLYVAGTVAGKREGYSWPGLVVRVTDKTINLPALTGKPEDPLNYLGEMSYTLVPGLKEVDEQVESAQEQLKWARMAWSRLERSVRKKAVPEAALIDAKMALRVAETALKSSERRRDERKAAGRSTDESRIDMEAGPGGRKALQGIYQLKGDILTVCYDEADRGRPETFAASKPSESLIILRRGLLELIETHRIGSPRPPADRSLANSADSSSRYPR